MAGVPGMAPGVGVDMPITMFGAGNGVGPDLSGDVWATLLFSARN